MIDLSEHLEKLVSEWQKEWRDNPRDVDPLREILKLLNGRAYLYAHESDPPSTIAELIMDDLEELGEIESITEYLKRSEEARELDLWGLLSSNIKEGMKTKETTVDKSFEGYSRFLMISAIIGILIAYFIKAPVNATIGYHFLSIIIKLASYSLILIFISALVSGVIRKFKTHTLIIFGWLLLASAIFDLGVAAYVKFVVEPKVYRVLEQSMHLHMQIERGGPGRLDRLAA